MAKGEAGLFVEYCAKDFLDGTQLLSPWEELAYRRICDMIYTTNDRLADDDRMLAWATKTGRRWPAVKAALTTGERPKLVVVDGRITNKRCTSALGTAAQKIAQKRGAGEASAATGKSLKNLKRSRTDVPLPVRTGDRTGVRTGARTYPLNHLTKEDSEDSDESSGAAAPEPATQIDQPKPEAAKRDPTKELWERGVVQLGNSSRSLIGKARREHGDLTVMAAIIACERESPSEPVEFFMKCLEMRERRGNGKQSPVAKLYEGAYLAAEEWERGQGNSGDNFSLNVPLLDRGRPH